MDIKTSFYVMVAFAGLLTGYFMAVYLSNYYTRRRWKRAIMCFFNNHAPDRIRSEVGGRNVQRCLYCDKLIYEYTVTKDGAKKNPTIRRTY